MIMDTVGQHGQNYSLDVAKVQKLLNQNLHRLNRISPLVIDGVAGDKTIQLIREYQAKILKITNPSGLIEPGNSTLRWLVKTALKPRPQHVDTFIIKVLAVARKIRSKYHLPVSIQIAKAALDSEWGKKIYNQAYFRTNKHAALTKPVEHCHQYNSFEHFASIEEAADSFARYLKNNPRYLAAFKYTNQPLAFARKLKDIDASNIHSDLNKLHAIMVKYHLTEFDN